MLTGIDVAYALIGGFVTIFSLVSLFIKERLYIGEATVAMIVGIIFGPVAANIFNPYTWGNTDYITLEVARIVIVVQVFAVGVELPKKYLKKHWKGVAVMLLPVMASSWFICAGFIYALIPALNFVESLVIAATLAPTDPVLASSVVGKGKFAERVPGHIRNLLSCESGCNDGMAFPFLYIGLYIILDIEVRKTAEDWILITILYECLFGILLGVLIGYGARRAIRYAEDHALIDRESFLVFYFVLALFCTGIGTVIGVDDFLVAFAAGAAFAWDGWFSKKTEESHVSNVIDLLLNMAFFVYFGAIIPWGDFNSPDLSITPWRLVVIAILVLLFRRIPGVFACYKICPDIRNWREALFCGHFGPIGVGALFFAILARAELETESQVPAGRLPGATEDHGILIGAIYPIVSFVVLSSIVVHGSSIAVFTLGKHVHTNVLPSMSMTFTRNRDSEDGGPNWLARLPRLEIGQSMTFSKSHDRSRSRDRSRGHIDKSAIGSAIAPTGVRSRSNRQSETELDNSHEPKADETADEGPEKDERDDEEIEAAEQHQHQQETGVHPDDVHYHEDGQQVFREGDQFIVEDDLGEVIRVVSNPKKLGHEAAHNLLDKEYNVDDLSREERESIVKDSDHPLYPRLKAFANGLGKAHEKSVSSGKGDDNSSSESEKTLINSTRSKGDRPEARKRSSTSRDTTDDSDETSAERARRLDALRGSNANKEVDSSRKSQKSRSTEDDTETPAERKRRLQALGHSVESGSGKSPRTHPPAVDEVGQNEHGLQAISEQEVAADRAGRQPTISFHASVDSRQGAQNRSSNTNAGQDSARLSVPESAGLPLAQSHSRGRSIVWADHSETDRDLENGARTPSRGRRSS